MCGFFLFSLSRASSLRECECVTRKTISRLRTRANRARAVTLAKLFVYCVCARACVRAQLRMPNGYIIYAYATCTRARSACMFTVTEIPGSGFSGLSAGARARTHARYLFTDTRTLRHGDRRHRHHCACFHRQFILGLFK